MEADGGDQNTLGHAPTSKDVLKQLHRQDRVEDNDLLNTNGKERSQEVVQYDVDVPKNGTEVYDHSNNLAPDVQNKGIQVDLLIENESCRTCQKQAEVTKGCIIQPAYYGDKQNGNTSVDIDRVMKRRPSLRRVAFELSRDDTGLDSDDDCLSDVTFQQGLIKGDRVMTDAALLHQLKHALQSLDPESNSDECDITHGFTTSSSDETDTPAPDTRRRRTPAHRARRRHPPNLSNHVKLACIVTFCCNPVLGGIALAFAVKSAGYHESHKYQKARKYSRLARCLSISGVLVTTLLAAVILGSFWIRIGSR